MKKYNFDKSIDRRLTSSYRWDIKENELSFTIADTDFLVADEIVKSINDRSKLSCYGYTYTPKEYFKAYVSWWKRRHNLELNISDFIFSSSVVASIDSIIKRITNVGDKISLFVPNYNVFFNCINNNNRIVEEIPLSYSNYEYQIDYDLFEKSIKESKAFILCNPHNPIGIKFSEEELIKIVDICKKHDVYIITDEIHADLDYNLDRYVPLFRVTDYSKAIMLVSPSKVFNVVGLHSSVIVIRGNSLRETIQKGVHEDDIGEPNYFAIDPVITAFNECENYVFQENEYIKENKRYLCDFFTKNELNLKIVGGKFTYLLWIDISEYTGDSDAFVKELKEETGIIVTSGVHYHQKYSQFIRVNIATQRKNIEKLCNGLLHYLKGNK